MHSLRIYLTTLINEEKKNKNQNVFLYRYYNNIMIHAFRLDSYSIFLYRIKLINRAGITNYKVQVQRSEMKFHIELPCLLFLFIIIFRSIYLFVPQNGRMFYK